MKTNFTFNDQDYAFVRDHCPQDHPVIPFVCVIDAFYTVLLHHSGPCVLYDIRLVKGIILPDFRTFDVTIHSDDAKKNHPPNGKR